MIQGRPFLVSFELWGRTDFRAVPAPESPDRSIVSQIILHKADQPDVVVNFLDAHGLSGKDLAEIDFFLARADASAMCHHDGFVVEGIVDVRQSLIDPR